MFRCFYTFILFLALPIIVLRMLWRSRKNSAYRHHLAERFGYSKLKAEKSIWIHAVSLGESIAAIPLIENLQKTYPNHEIIITNTTPTGRAAIEKHFGQADRTQNAYLPYDIPCFLKKLIRQINPKCLILMETELWPNCLAVCQQQDIPVILANARLSVKSYRGYQRFKLITQSMLNALSLVGAQYQHDADHFIQLGIASDKVKLTGNLKFDFEISQKTIHAGGQLRESFDRPFVWIAASTHPGEDEIVLAAHQKLVAIDPNALLILVPRHPERFNTVYELVQLKFQVITRSGDQHCNDQTQVYLGDTMGELLMLYAASDVAFVGGSLCFPNGHNFVEPAMLGKAIITGPYTRNFKTVSQMFDQADARIVIQDADTLAKSLIDLAKNQDKVSEYGKRGQAVAQHNKGALSRLFKEITFVIA